MWNLKYLMVCGVKGQLARVWASLRYFLIITLVLATAYAESGAQAVPPNSNQPDQGKPTMSSYEARRKIKEMLTIIPNPFGGYKNVRVTMDAFYFYQPAGTIRARNFSPVDRSFFFKNINNICVEYENNNLYVSFNNDSFSIFWGGSEQDAKVFVTAIEAMKYYSSGLGSADETANLMAFKEKARAWRALAAKPSLPASANRYRVLAEDAFKSKDFDKAIEYYDKGLEVYPLWPQGQFNAALICGEVGDYAEAVGHMKRYLELVPDAKDAKAAQEKIFIWEEKAK